MFHARRMVCLACLVALFAASASAETYRVEITEGIIYGASPDRTVQLQLDLAQPIGVDGPVPAVVYIHGGGWSGGNRGDLIGEMKRTAARGFVSMTISYRLAKQNANKFPAAVEDVKCAVRWLRAHAPELGVDPDRIAAVGYSAGAHLAMMLGTMDAGDGLNSPAWGGWSSKVNVVCSYVGPTDLLADYPPISQAIVANFIGGTKAERRDAYAAASPITYVDSSDAPMLLFQGTKDELVPWDQAVAMAEALTKVGVPGRVELCLGQNHGLQGPGVNHADELDRTRAALDAFLDYHFEQLKK